MSRAKLIRWFVIAILCPAALVVALELGLRAFANHLPPRLNEATNTVIHGTPYAQAWERAWIRNPDHYFILKPGLLDALQFGTPQVPFHVSTIELWAGGGIGFRTRPVDYFVDAVVVGDSFAFCFTERADCWVTRLEQLTGRGLVNLGLPGTGSRSHLLVLRDFGRPLAPPLVIWQFFGNDFNDDYGLAVANGDLEPLEAPPADTPRVQDDDGGSLLERLTRRSALIAVLAAVLTDGRRQLEPVALEFEERYETQLPNGDRLRFGQPYEPLAFDMARPANQAGFARSRAAIIEARELLASWGGQLALVLLPTREEVYEAHTARQMGADLDKIRSARLAMLGLCAELGLRCYDALGDLQTRSLEAGLLYYSDDMHLNPLGNRTLAEGIQAWLRAEGLLPR